MGFFALLDPTFLLFVFLPSMVLAGIAQAKVKSAYAKASKVAAHSGMTGADAAQEILRAEGITDVKIETVQGWLSDHYDPRHKTLRLSPQVHNGRSLAALGIAAHEVGHAIQHADSYGPLVIRNGLVPIAGIGSNLSFILIIGGLLLNLSGLATVGLVLFGATVAFQLVNLPVEFNASSRARERLQTLGMVSGQEDAAVGKVLNAAAMTYVAATITAILHLLYFVMLVAGARD